MELYNITENLRQLNGMIEEGVPADQLVDAFNDIEGAFQDKAKSILFVLQNMASNIEAIKTEEDRLKSKRSTVEKQLSGLKEYLVLNMIDAGVSNVDNGVFKASIVKPRPVLVVLSNDAISGDYKTESIVVSIDKKKMLSDLKEGKTVIGAEIGESKTGLKIK